MENKNYIKNFFSSFSLFQCLVVSFLFAVLAIAPKYLDKFVSTANLDLLTDILKGLCYAVFGGMALLGLTNLRNKKINFVDFLRFVGLIGSLGGYGLIALNNDITLNKTIFYCSVAGVLFIEIIIRSIIGHTNSRVSGIKGYTSDIANRFNMYIMFLLGVGIGICGIQFLKFDWEIVQNILNNYFYGIVIGVFLIVGVVQAAMNTQVTILDYILIVFTIALGTFCVFGLDVEGLPVKKLFILGMTCAGSIYLRALFYTADPVRQSRLKFKRYFAAINSKFDSIIPTFVAVVFAGFSFVGLYNVAGLDNFASKIGFDAFKFADYSQYYGWIVLGVVALCIILLILFRHLKSDKVVVFDFVLSFMLVVSAFAIVYAYKFAMNYQEYLDKMLNDIPTMCGVIAIGVNLILSFVLLLIRFKYYDDTYEYMLAYAAKAEQTSEPVASAKEPVKNEEPVVKEEPISEPIQVVEPAKPEVEPEYDELPDDDETPADDIPTDEVPVEEAPVVDAIAEAEVQVEDNPVEEAPVTDDITEVEAPVEDNSIEQVPAEETPVAEEVPAEEASVEAVSNEETTTEDDVQYEEKIIYVDENGNPLPDDYVPTEEELAAMQDYVEEPVEEAPVEEAPVEDVSSTEEIIVEEAQVDAVSTDETPVEEAPVEASVVEETLNEKSPTTEEENDSENDSDDDSENDSDDDSEEDETADEVGEDEAGETEDQSAESIAKEKNIKITEFTAVDEDGQPKKIKKTFRTRMMFANYEAKEFYNEVKNYLLMYRAKGRCSARCESFRYKGLVAKVALAGKSVKVCLAINPEDLVNTKYHFKNVSAKKQYVEVPTMIKIRSARGLKYFKELVDLMMAKRLVKPKRNFQAVNYLPQLIPNGESILATIGLSTDYLYDSMNARSIPEDMPDNLEDFLPVIEGEPLNEEEVEATVFLDTLCAHFNDGDEVSIDILKSAHVVTKGNVIRVKARGTLDKKLILYAEYFDIDALKMLMCTNCTVIKVVR